jgi:hypothetical protein
VTLNRPPAVFSDLNVAMPSQRPVKKQGNEIMSNVTRQATSSAITREAVEALAKQEGKTVLQTISALQAGAALLDDGEATLEALCAIKSAILDEALS